MCPRGRVMPCLSFEAYVRRNECFGSFGSWMGRLLDSGFLNSFRTLVQRLTMNVKTLK